MLSSFMPMLKMAYSYLNELYTQEEVIERAKKAKDKAARDAKEVQGPISSSIWPTIEVTSSPTTSTDRKQASNPDPDSETVVNQDPPLGDEE